MERALRERWPIKPEYREKIMFSLLAIVADKNASPREKTAAARALMAADAQNIEMEKMEQADEHEHRARLVAIAKHLGPERISELAARAGKPIVIKPKENQGDGTGSASGIPEATQGGSEGSFDNESEGYQPEDKG